MASSSTSQDTSETTSQATTVAPVRERIDAEVPLREAHPFDVWQYCLYCHDGGHLDCDTGHRREHCEHQAPVDLEPPPREELSWLKEIRRTSTTKHIIDMAVLVGGQQDLYSDYERHINERDALYLKMHRAMEHSEAMFDHEVWFRAMSAYNIFIDTFAQRCVGEVSRIVDRVYEGHKRRGDAILDFLYRHSSSEAVLRRSLRALPSFEQTNETIDSQLSKIKQDFEEIWARWEDIIQKYLARDSNIRHLHRTDASWMRKAFDVMIKVQPKLDFHPNYGVTWIRPDIPEVLRRERFRIPETET